MSVKTKKRFNNLSKIIGIGIFTLVMLTNIKLALLEDNEIASGDITVLGMELTLFDATYGEPASGCVRVDECVCSTYHADYIDYLDWGY